MTAAARAFVLADDLTGAADTALPFFGRGLSARIVLDADQPLPNADVLVLSTESRNVSEAEAIERVRHAAQRLRPMLAGSAPSLVYKKIDSTLRGWVGAEDGSAWIADVLEGPASEALGLRLAERLLQAGAQDLL